MIPRLHYWFTRRGRAEQIRLWMAELGLAWEEVDTPWRSEAWRALQFETLWFGGQPALVVGDFSLVQSGVIVSWLAREHGRMPADPRLAATVDALVWSAEDLRQAAGLAARGGAAAVETFLEHDWEGRFLPGLERWLERSGTGWLVGAEPTPADTSWWDALDQTLAGVPGATLPRGGRVEALFGAVARRSGVAAYLSSPRRPPP